MLRIVDKEIENSSKLRHPNIIQFNSHFQGKHNHSQKTSNCCTKYFSMNQTRDRDKENVNSLQAMVQTRESLPLKEYNVHLL